MSFVYGDKVRVKPTVQDLAYSEGEYDIIYAVTPEGILLQFFEDGGISDAVYSENDLERYVPMSKEDESQAIIAAQTQEIAVYREHLKTIIHGAQSGWTVDRIRRYAVDCLQGILRGKDGE